MSEQRAEALFANTTLHSRRHMQKAYRASTPVWLLWVVAIPSILVLAGFIAELYSALSMDNLSDISLDSWLAPVYIVFLNVYVLWLRNDWGARRYEKIQGELYPGKMLELKWRIFADHMEASNSVSEQMERAEYASIIRVKETKEQILMFRRQRLFYHLDKAGFEKGDAAAFIAFLKEKIPNAKFQLRK